MEVKTKLYLGDCKEVVKELPGNSVDLIFTSPPYADQRKTTYGGVHPDKYVDWFLPLSKELLRVLKPSGTFVLNIKEKVTEGERSTYVMELILAMRQQGWLWTEEFIWHKKTAIRVSGQTDLETHGRDFCSLIKTRSSPCTKMKSWYPWETGQNRDLEN